MAEDKEAEKEQDQIEDLWLGLSLIFARDRDRPMYRWDEANKRLDGMIAELLKLIDATYQRNDKAWAEKLGEALAPKLIRIANTKTRRTMLASLILAGRDVAHYVRHEDHTAWQWLRWYSRVPIDLKAGHYAGEYDKQWFYYDRQNTREADFDEYQQLKDLYIKKFGGWETIDLEHTEYDGHAWWE